MAISYRIGNKNDLPIVLNFLEKKTVFPAYIGYENPDIVRRFIARSFKAHKNLFDFPKVLPLMIAEDDETGKPMGYMILIPVIEESITGEKQTQIYDHYVEPGEYYNEIMDHFLNQTETLADEKGFKYITLEIQVTEKQAEEYFESRGFHIEMNRIVKRVGTYNFDSPRMQRFNVRYAEESDRMFILLLNAQNAPFLIPASREAEKLDVQNAYFDTYATLNITTDPHLKVFIAEDKEDMRSVGYIMIKTSTVDAVSAKLLAYVYDISVHSDYWGKHAPQRLCKEAENWLYKQNIHYLVGDTAQSNPRPLKTAQKMLGFDLYNRRWVKRI